MNRRRKTEPIAAHGSWHGGLAANLDAAVMSAEQKTAAQNKLNSLQEDLDHVTSKLQQAEQGIGQALLQEMAPKVQDVLREIIQKDGIALLLQRNAVIHAEPGYSITQQVTDKLNQLNAAKK